MRAPAGMKNHHAYRGGLLEHVVNMMEVALRIADRFPQVDNELLQIGCFLHDIGKIEELAYEQEYGYTDDGQLLGHILLGVDLLERKIRETERLTGDPFPEDTARRLKHMIASHHGAYEFGAPKLPMTLEAIALHYIDNLDAKIHSFEQLLRSDANFDSPWTHYHANLGRKLYKGRSEGEIAT